MAKIWQAGALATLLWASPGFAGTVFTDGSFTDWGITGYLSGPYESLNGGTSADTLATQGNPGAAYRIILGVPDGVGSIQWGIALAAAYSSSIVYNPSASGALNSIDASLDFNCVSSVNCHGSGEDFGFAIRQGGLDFIDTATNLNSGNVLPIDQWHTSSASGLSASDFSLVNLQLSGYLTNNAVHPDFTAAGAPISIGFYAVNWAGGSPYGETTYYDNFSATVNDQVGAPEPSSVILAMTGFAVLFIRCRKRLA